MSSSASKREKRVVPESIQNPLFRIFTLGTTSGLGLGYAPWAPGTFGSLLGIPLGLYLLNFKIFIGVGVCVLLTLLATPLAHRAGKHYGQMDDGRIVIDEVVGMALSLLGLRNAIKGELSSVELWGFTLFAFLVFRILDITKPYPARTFDQRATGFGVMADDFVAGLYGAIVVWGAAKIILS